MSGRRLTVTGATGLIGRSLLGALRDQDVHVTVLSRDPSRAHASLSAAGVAPAEVVGWDPITEPAPAQALAGRDGLVHLAGESVAQRWTAKARAAIRDSRVVGTHNLVEGLRGAEPRPPVLLSSSAIGYYGPHGEEPLDEEAPAGADFLAGVCFAWEAEAERASQLGMRVIRMRTGIVLDSGGGALAKLLTPFRLGLGGPIAGGRHYVSWISTEDVVGIILAALQDERWSGAINATAPEPVSNRDFSRALGHVLHRPALVPLPAAALRIALGSAAETATTGARVVPARPLVLGYRFRHPDLDGALRSALARA